jgi:enoyl-CoA hydratase/carnithine racemase
MACDTDIGIEASGFVSVVEIRRPPYNFVDMPLVRLLADTFERLDSSNSCRAIVLASQGKAFCAGGNFARDGDAFSRGEITSVYDEAVRLFRTSKPIVAAIHGAAIGGGLGLALVADFRITCAEAKFAANFARLGLNPGFGLTVTLPELIGRNEAELLFYTGRRIGGQKAVEIGLANQLVASNRVRDAAIGLAAEIAECAPLAVRSARATMRTGFADRIQAAATHAIREQSFLRATEDFKEGVRASGERRKPNFQGR